MVPTILAVFALIAKDTVTVEAHVHVITGRPILALHLRAGDHL